MLIEYECPECWKISRGLVEDMPLCDHCGYPDKKTGAELLKELHERALNAKSNLCYERDERERKIKDLQASELALREALERIIKERAVGANHPNVDYCKCPGIAKQALSALDNLEGGA